VNTIKTKLTGAKSNDLVREFIRLTNFLPGGFEVFGIIFVISVVAFYFYCEK
jgi:hypothetical protein